MFTQRRDDYGWYQDHKGNWNYTVFTENGRVLDDDKVALKTALLEVAKTGAANFRFTCNQNVILSDIHPERRQQVEDCATVRHHHAYRWSRRRAQECYCLRGIQYLPLALLPKRNAICPC